MLKYLNDQLLRLSWLALAALLLLHYAASWLLMIAFDEQGIITPVSWLYFYVTTATTVGYGDFSPATFGGRLVAALLLMPGAVVLFAAFVGKTSSFFITFWRKGMQGKADYSQLRDHIVILGWHSEKTSRMVQLIFGDTRRLVRDVVICADQDMENPFPDKVRFVRGEWLTDQNVFNRAAIKAASRVIIFQDTDDQTLATCLAVCATETRAHIVAWFEHARMARLVKSHCPHVECYTSLSVDLLVRSAQDPGSSRLQSQLLSTLEGPTQYSVRVPDNFPGTTFGNLLHVMKSRHEAIALGIADTTIGEDLLLNPPGDQPVRAGQLIYFMSAQRIRDSEIAWTEIAGASGH